MLGAGDRWTLKIGTGRNYVRFSNGIEYYEPACVFPGETPGTACVVMDAANAKVVKPRASGPGNGNGPGYSEDDDADGRVGVVTKTRPKTKKPSLYKVLLLNDDYTPMEFVVHVLERFFGKSQEEATQIMLHVHHKGVGICGVYTYEVAETKVTLVTDFARKHQHPLQCTMEKE